MAGGVKRDYQGKEKTRADPAPRNAYTSMFENFRDELDEHHDRRMKIQKVSRDVTALAKKMVRKLQQPIPARIQSEMDERMQEIVAQLATIEGDVQGMNRHRYNMPALEEFAEAVSFAHYLRHQTLITPAELSAALPLASGAFDLTAAEYVFGIFDLTGEMMRFATSVTALTGAVPSGGDGDVKDNEGGGKGRTILEDLQDVSSMLLVSPPLGGGGGKFSTYTKKTDTMVEQVRKVERLAYGVTVRGNERPKGWMPDLDEGPRGGDGGE